LGYISQTHLVALARTEKRKKERERNISLSYWNMSNTYREGGEKGGGKGMRELSKEKRL
jgi:hypothetical protein